MTILKQENITKAISSIGFILIIIALIVAWSSPAIGFESSIYLSTPLSFWLCLLFGIGFGIFIVIFQIYCKNLKNNLWILGLLLILIGNIVVLSLPVIRGYYLVNASGDTGTHMGIIQDLLIKGHIKDNIYPFIHIYIAEISQILGIGVISIVNRITIVFDILYMVFLYLAAKALLPRKEQVILTCLAGAALITGWFTSGVSPNSLGNLLFPLFFFLLLKSSSSSSLSWRTLFIIIIILLPLMHPILAFISIIILASLRIIAGIMDSKTKHDVANNEFVSIKPAWGTILFLLFWTITWIMISSPGYWGGIANNLRETVLGIGSTQLQRLFSNVNYAVGYGYSIINYFMRMYLINAIFGIMALVAFPILNNKTKHEPKLKMIIAFYSPLTAITLVLIVLYFFNLPFGALRLLFYDIVLLFIMVGFLLFEFIRWSETQKRALRLITIVLVGLFLFGTSLSGILSLYPSPYTYELSSQNTRSEITGMEQFLKQKDIKIYSSGWYYTPSSYAAFLLTPEEKQTRNDFSIYETKNLPFHFGYDRYSNLGSYFNADIYVVLFDFNRKVYTEVYPKMAKIRLLPSDFNKLDQDPTVNKLYENGGFEFYYVSAIK